MTALVAGGLAALLAVLLALLLLGNRLVRLRNDALDAARAVDVQLRRRHDLVPPLVEAVRAAIRHERRTLDRVEQARAVVAAGPPGAVRRAAGETRLTRELRALGAVVEANPRLATAENVLALQEELLSTENRVAFARQRHNDAALRLADALQTFPGSLAGRLFRVRPVPYLDLDVGG